jgi:hypothetical protein
VECLEWVDGEYDEELRGVLELSIIGICLKSSYAWDNQFLCGDFEMEREVNPYECSKSRTSVEPLLELGR